jgi:hypothetical protein
MDIIKNKMLAHMEKQHGVNIDDSYNRWQGLIEAVPDPTDQERFLRHYYNTYKHREEIKVDKVTHATRSMIIRVYETLINRDAALLFEEITNSAAIYGKLLRADFPQKKIRNGLLELAHVGSAPAYLVLLYLFSLDQKCFVENDFLEKVVNLMVRYFIRRNLTDKPPTREMDQALINIVEASAERLRSAGILGFDWFVDQIMRFARPATLRDFRESLEGPIYENNGWMARYVLIQLDQSYHTREYKPDFWERDDKDRLVWSVEHVLPQAEKLPDHWVEMIASGDKKNAADIQDKWVHSLGNLTMSGYNSDLATSSFSSKQKLAKDKLSLGHKINIGYQNGLHLNSLTFPADGGNYSLANAPHWDSKMIEARSKVMVQCIIEANLLPGESLSESS